jgi:FKBP-type peptidyl-prolyl cis-trans isomerase
MRVIVIALVACMLLAYAVNATDYSKYNARKGREFLEENAKKDSVTVHESGLQYEILEQGDGKEPTTSDTVKVCMKILE